ncbi:hypothetical protein FRC05_009052 [Tulasnella sp. 425]|nr:hypothetical protein FRC05_009052 [Tulasnella sp. 425]
MLTLAAGAHEQEPDATDLLIRAITTIIWLLWPKATKAKSHSKRHLQRLSRLSLLFVSANQAADVAAVTAIVGQSCVYVEAVQGSEELPGLHGHLNVAQNHIESIPLNARSLPDPGQLVAELLADPLRFCFKRLALSRSMVGKTFGNRFLIRGITAITPVAHGAALQNLLTTMYMNVPTCPLSDPSREPLLQYIYCFCHKKIRHRLQSSIPGHKGDFMGLFLRSKGRGRITKQDFERRTTKEPLRSATADEEWLYHRLAKSHPQENFGPKPTKLQPYYHLALNDGQLWMLWEFFIECLFDLDGALKWLDLNTRGTKPELYGDGLENLKTVAYRMKKNFVHMSPTFWSLVVEMENILSDRAGEKVVEDPRSLWSSPSNTNDPGSAFPPGHQEGSQESASRGADVSGGLDQVGLAHESDSGSPAHSDCEDSDDGLESEERKEKGFIQLSGIALQVRTWLRRVTQWHGAVYDLSQGRLALAVLNKELKIHVGVAPKAVQPQRQASLRAVVNSLWDSRTPNERLELILTRARELYGDWKLSENTPAYTLVNASVDHEASLEQWEWLFPSSSVHCEAHLASIMHEAHVCSSPLD